MNRPRLIGLYSTAPQSGKSTVATILGRWSYSRVSFAAPLKNMVDTFLLSSGVTNRDLGVYRETAKEEPIPEACGRSYRQLAQTLGTDWGRECVDPEVWVNSAMYRVNALPHRFVFDDVRFPNEAQAIKDAGGELWYIDRGLLVRPNNHPSEGLLDGWSFDKIITNLGDFEALASAVESAAVS